MTYKEISQGVEEVNDLEQAAIDAQTSGPGYYFDGVDDYISVADSADLDFGTGDGTVSCTFIKGSEELTISRYQDADNNFFIQAASNAFYGVIEIGGPAVVSIVASYVFTEGKAYKVTWVINNGSANTLCINRKNVSLSTNVFTGGNLALTKSLDFCKYNTNYYQATVCEYKQFNLALDLTDPIDEAIENGAAIPYKYQGASQVALTSGTLIAGKEYIIDTFVAGDDFTNIGGTNVTGNVFVATGTTPTTWTNSSSLRHQGCVADYNGAGVGHNTWVDNSGNELHGAVSGAIPTDVPANHTEKFIDLSVTGDTSFTLPKGYIIDNIILTSDGAIGGGIDIGTTNGGGEIVTAQAIAGAGTVLCALVAGANYNTTGADDTIYITDADGTGWDSASLEVRVQMKRIV